jgi:uncharacterized membrane protein
MQKGRLEAFSDGVIAIIITIMVLEFKAPEEHTLAALTPLIPVAASYVLSFIMVGIYWNNHHHLMHAAKNTSGSVLWANLHLLFWLSLIPFFTSWIGESNFAAIPVIGLGGVMFFAGFAYYILSRRLIAANAKDSALAQAVGRDYKGWLSLAIYLLAILAAAFLHPLIGFGLYVVVAILWFIPDRRIEARLLSQHNKQEGA